MSKVAIQGAATGTGVFTLASPATNTDRTLVLPDEAGTVLTTATLGVPVNGPAFSAYQETSQTPTAFVWTKVTLDAKVFDTNSCFDTSLSRFQPTVAGYYQLSVALRFPASTSRLLLRLAKNGTLAMQFGDYTALYAANGSTLMYLNGTTDFVEFYMFTGSSTATSNVMNDTWFSGALIRSTT